MFFVWLLWEFTKGVVAMVAVFIGLVWLGVLWVMETLVDLVRGRDKPIGSAGNG